MGHVRRTVTAGEDIGKRLCAEERIISGARYRLQPFGSKRRMAAAAASVNRQSNTIHFVTEVDVTEPRRLIASHHGRTGERLSLTAYVVTCLARVCAENPQFNSFRKGSHLVILDDVTISVLFEREFDGEKAPEPVGIHAANRKTYREINDEIRAVQKHSGKHLGSSTGLAWTRFIPGFLLRCFIRLASQNIGMQKRFGVVSVTAVGMFGSGPMWALPLTAATVTAAVGTVATRVAVVNGVVEEREHLCMTLSFNHDIIDGAPAARFTKRLAELMSSGEELRDVASPSEGSMAGDAGPRGLGGSKASA